MSQTFTIDVPGIAIRLQLAAAELTQAASMLAKELTDTQQKLIESNAELAALKAPKENV